VENDIQQEGQVVQPLVSSVVPSKPKKPILPIVIAVLALILLVLLGGARYYVATKLKMIKNLTESTVPVKESTDSSQTPAVDAASIDASIDSIQGDLNTLDSDLNAETELNLDSSILDINN